MRTNPGRVEPEIYFRIVQVAHDGHQGAPVVACREQNVEIALGPKGAFENANIGALTRRVPANTVVMNAALTPRGKPKPPREPKTPRVTKFLRKAIEWRRQLDAGEVSNQAAIARREGITRARVTQILGMLRLAPEIRAQILSTPDTVHRPPVTERMLRPINAINELHDQVREFQNHLS